MKRLACWAAPRRTLRLCGFLLAAFALTPALAFADVNRWHDAEAQQEVQS